MHGDRLGCSLARVSGPNLERRVADPARQGFGYGHDVVDWNLYLRELLGPLGGRGVLLGWTGPPVSSR
jgi:hypothetical protein